MKNQLSHRYEVLDRMRASFVPGTLQLRCGRSKYLCSSAQSLGKRNHPSYPRYSAAKPTLVRGGSLIHRSHHPDIRVGWRNGPLRPLSPPPHPAKAGVQKTTGRGGPSRFSMIGVTGLQGLGSRTRPGITPGKCNPSA